MYEIASVAGAAQAAKSRAPFAARTAPTSRASWSNERVQVQLIAESPVYIGLDLTNLPLSTLVAFCDFAHVEWAFQEKATCTADARIGDTMPRDKRSVGRLRSNSVLTEAFALMFAFLAAINAVCAESTASACIAVARVDRQTICRAEIETPKQSTSAPTPSEDLEHIGRRLLALIDARIRAAYERENKLSANALEVSRASAFVCTKQISCEDVASVDYQHFVRTLVTNWKVDRSLQTRFGGRVVLTLFGPVAREAAHRQRRDWEKAGRLEFFDQELAPETWRQSAFINGQISSAVDGREVFRCPMWEPCGDNK